MGFKKGVPNINRTGRIGPNHSTKQIKEAFSMLLDKNLDNMSIWLAQVAGDNPEKAMDIMIKLSERFVPKLSQQQITDGDGGDLFKNIEFKFGEPEQDKPE